MLSKQFKEDLKVGEKYEEEVAELFGILMEKKLRRVTPETDPSLYRYMDIIEDTGKKKPDIADCVTVECKFSKQDSPNVIIEYEGYGKPSGIATSLAKYYAFNTERFHIIVERAELLKMIVNDLLHRDGYKKVKVKDFDNKRILIVPIKVIMTECPSAIKQLRIPIIERETNGKRESKKPVEAKAIAVAADTTPKAKSRTSKGTTRNRSSRKKVE